MKLKPKVKAGYLGAKNSEDACAIYEKWYKIKGFPDIKKWAKEGGCAWAK